MSARDRCTWHCLKMFKMALSSRRLVTSIMSPRAGKEDPNCSKTKLTVRLHPREYFTAFLPTSVRMRDWIPVLCHVSRTVSLGYLWNNHEGPEELAVDKTAPQRILRLKDWANDKIYILLQRFQKTNHRHCKLYFHFLQRKL